MMPNMGKRMAGSMAVMDSGITSVTQYIAINSNTNAHFASCGNKRQISYINQLLMSNAKPTSEVINRTWAISFFLDF